MIWSLLWFCHLDVLWSHFVVVAVVRFSFSSRWMHIAHCMRFNQKFPFELVTICRRALCIFHKCNDEYYLFTLGDEWIAANHHRRIHVFISHFRTLDKCTNLLPNKHCLHECICHANQKHWCHNAKTHRYKHYVLYIHNEDEICCDTQTHTSFICNRIGDKSIAKKCNEYLIENGLSLDALGMRK